MTIAAKILQLNGVKEDIRDAIESFGYDLSNADFTEYAQYICAIGTATTIQITADGTNAGTISDDLTELTNVKTDIKNAIESKGIDLTNVAFSSYAQYIYQIPVGSPNYLKFTANQNGSIGWSSATYPNLEFSKNGDSWATFNDTVNVNTGDYVEFRNNGTAWTDSSLQSHFTTTGSFDLSGNIMSLVDNTVQTTTIPINNCFKLLFYQCGIVNAGYLELAATTLASYCYNGMFLNCSSLTSAPALPATTLATNCYNSMFSGCNGLTTAPALPATTLATHCYNSMFSSCHSLASAPALPATTLADSCYYQMFSNCSALTTAPALPATKLMAGCYSYMFQNCSSLNYVSANFLGISYGLCTENWLSGVSSTGTFVKNLDSTWNRTGNDGVPSGWSVVRPLSFTGVGTVTLTAQGSAPSVTLYTNDTGDLEGQWSAYTVGDTITLQQGDRVMFSGTNGRMASGASAYNYFVMTGTIEAHGDATSLLNGDPLGTGYAGGGPYAMTDANNKNTYCFESLFKNCTSLTSAPELPSTTLCNSCYQNMFYGCTGLTTPPSELPRAYCYCNASTGTVYYTSRNVYNYMFYNCTSLTRTPILNGIANGRSTYARQVGNAANYMFAGCTSLTDIYAYGNWTYSTTPNQSSSPVLSAAQWMANVPENVGTIHLPSNRGYTGFDNFLNNRGVSGAPVGWTVVKDLYPY